MERSIRKLEEVVGFEPTACFYPTALRSFTMSGLLLYQLSYTSCFCNEGTLTLNLPPTKQDSCHLSYIAYYRYIN